MLPTRMKNAVFDTLSNLPMRYVHPVPPGDAEGLVAEVYQQIVEDAFINGALTCQSIVPPLLAANWCGGREAEQVTNEDLRDEVRWALSTVDSETDWTGPPPFEESELPEALGSVFTFGYVNRVRHVTMADSPIKAPFGLRGVKRAGIRLFGGELENVADGAALYYG